MLKKEIESRIVYLGGNCNFQGSSLYDDLMSISFDRCFLLKDFWDGLQQESYDKIKGQGVIPESELRVYPRIEINPFLYTPFKEGTADYDDEYDVLEEFEDYAKSIVGENIQEFLVVGYSDSERWVVNLADQNPINPQVYIIDMDLPFSENCLLVHGTLENYFNSLLSADEYQKAMEEHVEKHCSK